MAGSILCFGEVLLRLGAPGREMLLQTPRLDVHVGGAEANVAVSLARFGHAASMASIVPAGPLGDAAIGELRRHGVDTRAMQTVGDGRMGLYFLETGALHRPSAVHYDRQHSAFARAAADAIDWDAWLPGAARLHLSGVTPALGAAPAQAAIRAARAATAAGVPVSFDGNYRAALWKAWDGDAPSLLRQVMQEADVVFADERDIAIVLGTVFEQREPQARFEAAAEAAFAAFPRLSRFAATRREQHDVDRHSLGARMATRGGALLMAPARDLGHVVDRIGAGDAFAAGVLHGLHAGGDDARALHFGLAAAWLKHSIPGDFNLVDAAAVEAAMQEGGFGVRR